MEKQDEDTKQPEAEEQQEVDFEAELDSGYIERAEKAAERLEAATENLNKTIQRQQAFMAKMKMENILGGRATAHEGKEEESPVDYAKKVMANEAKTQTE